MTNHSYEIPQQQNRPMCSVYQGMMNWGLKGWHIVSIESIDSISRDGPDMPYICNTLQK